MPHPVPSWLTGAALPWANEEASVLGTSPLIVADVTEAEQLAAHRAELGAAVLIGVDEAGALPPHVDVFDVLLTSAPSPPRPWVQVQSIDEALQTLGDTVAANPHAAVTLAQVLRAQRELPFEAALVMESFAYSSLLGGTEFRRWRDAKPRGEPVRATGPAVLVERAGDTMRITLARPETENALTAEMRDHLVEQLRVARMDPTLTTVEIAAHGRIFCTGGHFDEFGIATDLAMAHQIRTIRSVALALHRVEAHTRVIVQGAAVGGGIEFAAAGREVVAHPSAFFRLPEVSMGLIPGAGGTVTVARRIGWQRACYMALSGIDVRARTALAWGLVDRIADA